MKRALTITLVPQLAAAFCSDRYSTQYSRNPLARSRSSCVRHSSTNDNGDDEATSTFGTREYWDEVYYGRGDFPADEYSWYYSFEGYKNYVLDHIPKKSAKILIPGIGNDTVLLDLLQKGYTHLTAFDYSEPAIERQEDLLSYVRYSEDTHTVRLSQEDARDLPEEWTDRFDAILEKGALDAIYLSGSGNLEKSVQELERVLKPGGVLISVSGVVPEELRRSVFGEWEWLRDGSDDLEAGRFVLKQKL